MKFLKEKQRFSLRKNKKYGLSSALLGLTLVGLNIVSPVGSLFHAVYSRFTVAAMGDEVTKDTSMAVVERYEKELAVYNQLKNQYDEASARYNEAQLKYQQDLEQFKADEKAYQKAVDDYNKALAQYEVDKTTYTSKKQEYDEKLANYRKLKEAWDDKKTIYDNEKSEYDKVMNPYNEAFSEYQRKMQERTDTIKRNKEADEAENQRRREAYEEALRQYEIDSKKPGRFKSDIKNTLAFTHEPNANAHIDIGTGGALALVKGVDTNWRFNWSDHWRHISSDRLDEATLRQRKLDTRVFKEWDPTLTFDEDAGSEVKAPTYIVLAKKNTPFKVTYTNIENSTYDGKKISKIEYIYEVLETGSDSDLMQLSIAKDPTISVWVRGANGSATHGTRVKLTPIFYDQNGQKIIPADNKPIYLGMGSMNAGNSTLDERNSWFFDGKDLFSELMGFPFDRAKHVERKFYEKYGVKWEDRNKDGFYNTIKPEWEGPNGLFKQYWNEWDEVIKPFNQKFREYMSNKYGADAGKWPSQYREIVYELSHGKFIKLNDSHVDHHPDGYYSDTSIDSIGGWDNPTSKTQYIGAGVIEVTEDNFSMEFGSTTPKQQRFALNTIVADMYLLEKPKLELQKTPEPPVPVEPTRPVIDEPADPGDAPPSPPAFNEEEPVKPTYNGPEKPTPPVVPTLVEPTPPDPIKPPEGAVPNDAPKVNIPDFNGGVVPLDPPTVIIPEYNEPIGIPGEPEVHEKPEFKGGVVPLDPPIVEIPEYKEPIGISGIPEVHEKPEYKGGAVPLDPPVVTKPEYKISPEKPKKELSVVPQKQLPKTGDASLFVSAAGVMMMGIGALVRPRRKK